LWYVFFMGIFDRLGDMLKSYLNSEDRRTFGPSRDSGAPFGDPDLEAAYEELDELLGRNARNSDGRAWESPGSGGKSWESPGSGRDGTWGTGSDNGRGAWGGSGGGPEGRTSRGAFDGGASGGRNAPPEELRPDFAELGLPFGASAEECKAAYKKLLNIHHPDRHAGHPGNMKKATEKSARINTAYDRIEKWRNGRIRNQ
jgi:DnaJ-domain-containing protein 1